MNIAVIGSGYVGLTVSLCLAEMGNEVTCVDKDAAKVQQLSNGELLTYEPGAQNLLQKNVHQNLFFTTNLSAALQKKSIIFIAVGTPLSEDGKAYLDDVFEVAKEIGDCLTNNAIIVTKSTVPVGTTHQVEKIINQQLHIRNQPFQIDVISNPEFLKEGSAIQDFMKPDRIILGYESEKALQKMKQLYAAFFRTNERFIVMDIKSAEMTKYASNAFLATKISFINEIATICEHVGADVNKVRLGVGSDSRIGYNFLYPGVGYGGSCFPKDVQALSYFSKQHGYEPKILPAVAAVNHIQKHKIIDFIVKRFNHQIADKTFCIWGLAFKPGTDDMREAPSLIVIEKLLKLGARIQAYDPKAMSNAKKNYFGTITYCNSKYEALHNADALILLTEWKEFRSPDFEEIKQHLKQPIIFDGRNQYHHYQIQDVGFELIQIGKTNL